MASNKQNFLLLATVKVLIYFITGTFCAETMEIASDTSSTGSKNSTFFDYRNSTRIVGGTWVKKGEYPHQAALMVFSVFNCGGSLIDNNHLLTAAHCLNTPGIGPEKMRAYLRTTALTPLDTDYFESPVQDYLIHPDFNEKSFENDIAIVTLSKPVPAAIRRVKLELPSNETYVNREGTVVGWGHTRQILFPEMSPGPSSNHLRQVNVTVISQKDCTILYYDEFPFKDNSRLCASTLHGKGICQGDSGSALFIDGVQVGINSAVIGCADPRYPAVFTRISHYWQWILTNTK